MKGIDRTDRLAVALLTAILLLMSATFLPAGTGAAEKFQHLVNCDLHKGTCMQPLQGTNVILEVAPKPVKAMTDLRFTVRFTGNPPSATKAPFIDLGMPGMNMGPNRVLLESSGPSVYEGRGIIVRCPSGRRIWQATVTVPDLGSVRFVFDVIY